MRKLPRPCDPRKPAGVKPQTEVVRGVSPLGRRKRFASPAAAIHRVIASSRDSWMTSAANGCKLVVMYRRTVLKFASSGWLGSALAALWFAASLGAKTDAQAEYEARIQPLLARYCFDCHGDGMDKGKVSLDTFASHDELLAADELWLRVLKNVRAGLMPPEKKPQLSAEEMRTLETWIKRAAFGLDPADPDPGRVTVRRLNRIEYRNTIRDLTGVEFNTEEEFSPDDTGYGFDNIGDVLSISPLLLEKYLQAAEKIVAEAVPTVARVVREKTIPAREFSGQEVNPDRMSFYQPAKLESSFEVPTAGDYRVTLSFNVRGDFNFDPGRANLIFKIDGEEVFRQEFGWDNKKFDFPVERSWATGRRSFAFELEPLSKPEDKKTSVDLRLNSVKITGPLDPKHWAKTKNYDRFFHRDEPPSGPEERKIYAREILTRFGLRAFRRPVPEKQLERLAGIALEAGMAPGKTFEQGIALAMVAILASPRFLFRIEESEDPAARHAQIDEYALASRLSYFLWSTLPDEELFQLAGRGELRRNLDQQVRRMARDERARAFVNNFTGQWLQVRDVAGIALNERAIAFRDSAEPKPPPGERRRWRGKTIELDGELRRSMQEETQEFFRHVMSEDRPVLEMVDSDYTFLNERLAKHYGIDGVEGRQIRKVQLPPDSPRGGLLTHGSILVVTSNPTRTSPVKRGLFLLDNILGTPAPPPPAAVPDLEEAEKEFKDREPTLREALELHRAQPLCSSCHNRMDPLGLALENFNALGMWREQERGQSISPAGKLITGETFANVRELRKVLAENRRLDFYRCLTEKMLTYALGRGVEYYDTEAVDRIVSRLEAEGGRFSSLLYGVIESAPFQKRRNVQAAGGTGKVASAD